MINWGRWLVRLLLVILVGLFERVMGLPVAMIILTSLYAGRLDQGWRWGLLLVVATLTAALFMVPLSMAWLVIGSSYLWSKHARQFLPSRILRLITGGLVGSVVLIMIGLGQIHSRQLVYGLLAIVFCTIWLKRHRLHLK